MTFARPSCVSGLAVSSLLSERAVLKGAAPSTQAPPAGARVDRHIEQADGRSVMSLL